MVCKQTIVKATLSVAFILSWGQYASAMYDPMLGRFASRDPIGYDGGVSMYRAYFASKGLDPTGECDCCCCPDRLDLSNITPKYVNIKDRGVFGYEFAFKVLATLKMSDERVEGRRGCHIEWRECSSVAGDLGQKAGEWFRPPSPSDIPPGNVVSDWNEQMPGCGSSFQRYWADAPTLLPSAFSKPRIDIRFAVRISGGEDCTSCSLPITSFFSLHIEQTKFDPSFPEKTTFAPDPLTFDVGLTGEPNGCTKESIQW